MVTSVFSENLHCSNTFGPKVLVYFKMALALESTNMPVEKAAEQKKLKPCCACPETKKVRDACIIEKGEVNCQPLIEAHKECMRKMGFNI